MEGRLKYKGRRELKDSMFLINFDTEETLVALIGQFFPYRTCWLEHLNGHHNYEGPILSLNCTNFVQRRVLASNS